MIQEHHHQPFLGASCCYYYYPHTTTTTTTSTYSSSDIGCDEFEVVPSDDHGDTVTCSSFQSSNTEDVSSDKKNRPILQSSAGTLQSLVKSGYRFDQNHSSAAKMSISNHHNPKVECRPLREPAEATFSVTSYNDSVITRNRANPSAKTRIRWTHRLHEQFLECVHHLGGAQKATPKRILKMMNCNGLTIFHVKSHLQKYRTAKYIPDSSMREKCETDSLQQLDPKTGLEIVEALREQIDVQRRLCEQLKSQTDLQRQIEEQGKQLKKMLELQMRNNRIN